MSTRYQKPIAVCLSTLALIGGVRADETPKTEATVAATATFDILEFDVDGDTVLGEKAIDDAVLPFMGPDRHPEDVDKARSTLEALYKERGYKTVSVAIPKQSVQDGVVHLQVLEARVGHLNVVGSKYHSLDEIKAEVPALAEGGVPNFNDVQQELVEVNQEPDRRVTPALKAGVAPDTIDVDLAVDDSLPVHGSLELNNRKSQSTSELRAVATLSYANLWQAGHSASLSYQTAPERTGDAEVFSGSYSAPLRGTPFSLLADGFVSNSNVATVGGIDTVGKGQVIEFKGIYTAPGAVNFFESFTAGVAYKNFRNRITLGSESSSSSFQTPVQYYPFNFSYDATLRDTHGSTQGNISYTFASPKLGSSDETFDQNRTNSRGEQDYFRASLTRTEDLPWRMQGMVRVTGSYADQPLISNEEFTVGGMDTVRGYLEAEALGDYGYDSSVELRSPSLVKGDQSTFAYIPFQELRFYGFVDDAHLRLHDANAGQTDHFDLTSFGFGATMQFYRFMNASIDWAEPIQNGPATHAWSSRVLFMLRAGF